MIMFNQPIELNVEIPLRRFQWIRTPTIMDDFLYLNESAFNIVQKVQILLMKQCLVQTVLIG